MKQEAKVLRDLGREYTSFTTKKVVPKKSVNWVDCSKCRLKCTERISEEQRAEINCSYWSTGKYARQKDFICSTVLSRPVMCRRKPKPQVMEDQAQEEIVNPEAVPRKRNVSYEYTFKV